MACITTNPVVVSDPYCPEVERGQIFRIRTTRTKVADVIADPTDLEEWMDRLDDAASGDPGMGAAPIRTWNGVGSTAEGENTEVPLPFNQYFSFAGKKTLPFKVIDMTPENRAAAKAIRAKGSVPVRFWVEAGTLIYSGNDESGILGRMTADIVIPEGSTEIQSIQLNFTFPGGLGEGAISPFEQPSF